MQHWGLSRDIELVKTNKQSSTDWLQMMLIALLSCKQWVHIDVTLVAYNQKQKVISHNIFSPS